MRRHTRRARGLVLLRALRILFGPSAMFYISTRGQTRPHTFTEAVEAGLAADGGLFLPQTLPSIAHRLPEWAGLSYAELAAEFFQIYAPDISADEWRTLTKEAYSRF